MKIFIVLGVVCLIFGNPAAFPLIILGIILECI